MHWRYGAIAALAITLVSPVRADDASEARAIVGKALQAMGGESELGKYKALVASIKGELHSQGADIKFTGELATQGADQEKIRLNLDFDGQLVTIVHVLNRDRGWLKLGEDTMEMDKDELAEALEEAHAGWVASLVPLKDKEFTLATVGDIEVDGKPAVGVRVSYPGRRDVNLFFDKASHLLVKTETRVRDEESGQEMTEESFFSGYDGKDVQTALKIMIKRDGKPYLAAELSDIRLEQKLDDSVFAKP